jgi:Holliday junction DNA helicase RuvA
MIESIRGIVEACTADTAVIRLGNVSLRLGVTGETVRTLKPGEPTELYAHLYLREDVMALYGFGTREERSLFEALMGVTGVGPRAALGFLSVFSPGGLRDAIEREDITGLIRVPGIGRKTAQRVVLELKGKLSKVGGGAAQAGPLANRDLDLITVLTGLGYSAAEAEEALRSTADAQGTGSDEDRIRAALRYFAGH